MMGLKERAFAPLVAVSLEELVPRDHFYRHLQKVLDLSFVHDLVRECYAAGGRPSIDPLDEPLPDHSTLSKIRQRYGLEVFRRFFESIVEQCRQAKLVWGQELYFDSTQVNANADLDSLAPRFAVEAREAIQEHLAALFAPEPGKAEDTEDSRSGAPLPERLPQDASCALPTPLPVTLSEAGREELAVDNAARHDWIAQGGRQQRAVHGLYRRTADFRISMTDPDATPMRLKGGGIHLGYHTHYVVDGGKRRIILAVLVTPGEVMDNQPMLDLLWHVYFRWRVRPKQATGDTAYGTIENIKGVEDAHIRAYVPLPDLGVHDRLLRTLQVQLRCATRSVSLPTGAATRAVSDRVQSAESGVPGGCSHLQCLSTQSAMYFQRPGSATAPFVLRRLLGTCEGVSPVLRLSESHEQAQGLGRTAVCRGQRLAWDAAVSLAAALESQL